MFPVDSRPAFERNFRDVRIVLSPDFSTARAIDSRPAVKFRLTGTLPASDTAMLANEPPTDAGRRRPMWVSPARRRLTHRDSISEATSVRPNVIGFVVASAIENVRHSCLAVRTN